MKNGLVLIMALGLFMAGVSVNAETTLYQNDFSSGTEGASISSEGWTNADTILYTSGAALRVVPQFDTTGLSSELAFSHPLLPGEVVTLQAELVGYNSADVAIGLRTTNHVYRAITRVPGDACLSTIDYDGVQVNSLSGLSGLTITYRITLTQNTVSFEMKPSGGSWMSLGSAAINETAITHIVLGSAFGLGTNPLYYGSAFQWDNIQLFSMMRTVAPVFAPAGPYISGPTPVSITCPTVGASIYYTTNGDTPTKTQTATNFLYDVNTPVVVNGGTTLKAIAVSSSLPNSEVTSRTYIYSPERADLTRGHYLLIEKGLQLQAWAFPATFGSFNLTNWNLSNFTTLNTVWTPYSSMTYLPAAPGIPWSRLLAIPGESDIISGEVPFVSNLVSLQLSDELPLTPERISQFTSIMGNLRNKYPDVIFYSNQYGDQATVAQLQSYMQTAQPDMLMFDNYPFRGNLTGGSPKTYYSYVQKYRLLGLAGNDGTNTHPIPCALYTQTYTGEGLYHVTSESEIRLNQFSAWSFGYKFVSDFLYGNPNYKDDNTTLFSNNGRDDSPTTLFYQVAETNRQSRNLGPALVRLISTDVRMIMGLHGSGSGSINDTPPGITAGIAVNEANPYITGVSADNPGAKNNSHRGDVIVGFFMPLHEAFDGDMYTNQKYFMITNGLSDAVGTAAETRQNIHIIFNLPGNITSLQRLSRTTGQVEVVPLVSEGNGVYTLDLELEGGTGDLFKYNTGAPFVGVTQVQTPTVHGTVTYADYAGYPLNTVTIEVRNGSTVVETHPALALTGSAGSKTYTFTTNLTGPYTLAIVKNAQTGWKESVQTGVTLAADTTVNFTVTHALAGDASMDGKVDVSDLGILAANYGGTGKSWDLGDFSGDGKVDVSDLGILAAHYGQGSGGATQAGDLPADMKALGLSLDSSADVPMETQKTQTEDNPVVKSLGGCGSAGLPLIAGVVLLGLMLVKLKD